MQQNIKTVFVSSIFKTYLTVISLDHSFAGSLEAAYSLNWGAQEIRRKGGGETLALL